MKKVDLKKRKQILSSGRGFFGLLALSLFSGLTGAFAAERKPKVIRKEIVVRKEEAVWG